MKHRPIDDGMIDLLTRSLDREGGAALRARIAADPAHSDELRAIEEVWDALGAIPDEEPSPDLSAGLRSGLAGVVGTRDGVGQPPDRRGERVALIAAAFLVAAAGLVVMLGNPGADPAPPPLRALALMRAVSDGTPATAIERLSAIHAMAPSAASPAVNAALLDRLDHDPSLNVRLAAVEALAAAVDGTTVRGHLLRTLPLQPSALVQIDIIDLLLDHGREPAADLERLGRDDRLEPVVRRRARWAAARLDG